MTDIKIPHGFKQVTGYLQKGDGLWDGRRFRKVRKEFPFLGLREGVAIRRCEVVQTNITLQDINSISIVAEQATQTEEPLCLDE